MNCPCSSGRSYENCCGPFLSGKAAPPTAEALMRSRYTAYTFADIEYIQKTLAPESQNDFDIDTAKLWATRSEWKGLKIITTKQGGPSDRNGVVEFIATYSQQGIVLKHHEVSQFRKNERGEWLFVNGDAFNANLN